MRRAAAPAVNQELGASVCQLLERKSAHPREPTTIRNDQAECPRRRHGRDPSRIGAGQASLQQAVAQRNAARGDVIERGVRKQDRASKPLCCTIKSPRYLLHRHPDQGLEVARAVDLGGELC